MGLKRPRPRPQGGMPANYHGKEKKHHPATHHVATVVVVEMPESFIIKGVAPLHPDDYERRQREINALRRSIAR